MEKSISELKSILKAAGVNISGCLDKESLVELYQQYLSRSTDTSETNPTSVNETNDTTFAYAKDETGAKHTAIVEADGREFCWLWAFLLCAAYRHCAREPHITSVLLPKGVN